ncbi:hypothetical protein SAMN06295909_2523 [Plantibacter sp. VKM Ac-1784]|uniref:Secreted protein n=1 Tax=Plantibacter elymi (nom. nud.) TaxID=199708 RepID=A0ABY1REJ6_9MICO|nr:hypothetical protein [Plantibacter sp. VKM Ac-1784]SMQ71281.1 hypothetical protein SAMN06295909_2523 [Plantibacter sp. VKM Ac-1784]
MTGATDLKLNQAAGVMTVVIAVAFIIFGIAIQNWAVVAVFVVFGIAGLAASTTAARKH